LNAESPFSPAILTTAQLASPESRATATPMMEQFIEIKANNPDSLLFYRMGDFYELFFEDAVDASRALGITLTKRGQHLGQDIPMCGVPVHAADDYLQKLISLGFRVAVCEQTEDPAEAKKRGSKSVVRRDVTRLVTPGTLTEEKLLDPSQSNFLMAWRGSRVPAKRSTGWPGSTFPPGRSMSAKAGWRGCWPTSPGSSRAS
jgi:DNA mismatch repair protein MutS